MPILIPGDGSSTPSTRYTASELVEETLEHLSGYTADMGQVTWLTEDLDEASTTMKVAESDLVPRGIAEVGYELVNVASSSEGTVQLTPTGRGYRASQAQAWPADTEVTFAPRFPRHMVLKTLNDVIANIWPQLYGVAETTFAFQPTVLTFPLPADVEEVIGVEWDPVGPQDTWVPIDVYKFNRHAATADFPTGRSIDLGDGLTPGRTVRVRYMKRPTVIEAEGQFTDSGLATSAWNAIMYGALHRLAASLTLGQLGMQSAQANEYSRVRPINAVEVSQQYYALHVQFVNEERQRLQAENPIRINLTR